MDLDRHVGKCLDERGHEFTRCSWRENAGHVLDAKRIDAHFSLGLGELHVVRDGVHGRGRVGDRTLRVTTVLLDGCYGLLEVARIVQSIEHAEDVHPVLAGKGYEAFDDIVRIVLVAKDVLTAQKHLKRCLGTRLLDEAQTFPRIFAQESHAHVKRGSAPALQRIVAGLVDLRGDGKNVIGAHARSPERLVRVAKRGVGDANLHLFLSGHGNIPFLVEIWLRIISQNPTR